MVGWIILWIISWNCFVEAHSASFGELSRCVIRQERYRDKGGSRTSCLHHLTKRRLFIYIHKNYTEHSENCKKTSTAKHGHYAGDTNASNRTSQTFTHHSTLQHQTLPQSPTLPLSRTPPHLRRPIQAGPSHSPVSPCAHPPKAPPNIHQSPVLLLRGSSTAS